MLSSQTLAGRAAAEGKGIDQAVGRDMAVDLADIVPGSSFQEAGTPVGHSLREASAAHHTLMAGEALGNYQNPPL